jgi:23S rRNA pseudouridine955/2504/2580 synthase
MSRGRSGPRQPGGGRQSAGPRVRGRGNRQKPQHYSGPRAENAERSGHRSGGKRHTLSRHPKVRANVRAEHASQGGKSDRPSTDLGLTRDRNKNSKGLRPPPPDDAPKAMQFSAGVQTVSVTPDESGMRVDRFFEARFPGLSFSHIQRIIRKGEVRVNGKRTQPKNRLEAGQAVRIPPLKLDPPKPRDDAPQAQKDRAYIKSITLYEDADVLVLNKPMGLAVQGGSGTTRHLDGMLGALRGPGVDAQRPRLVHRLDKDTAGCLLVAKTRFAAAALAKTFRTRSARKIYWALVVGVPKPKQGRVSTFLAKQ